ncbi:unnamed protein product [Acanthoscelides obtectus]|uniref:Uncharacterized protein n=1 Tax=Acanthoscelides obtectus TaxID=200917 RepID=A0A9P0L8Z0_ACAOB|nr:unnamed protein product [Acanthoscelides obtectus]CAK1635625.1 hypothetical protein AOBTE_LOCUS9397 [Acanthoscelides obtectus]
MMIIDYFYILQIISPSLKCIIHKFLPRGHTHMEADHIHALIERVIKKQPTMKICTPWDWQQDQPEPQFSRCKLQELRGLIFRHRITSHSKETDKESFLVSSAVWLEVRKQDPGILYYKTGILQEDYKIQFPASNIQVGDGKVPQHPKPLCREAPNLFASLDIFHFSGNSTPNNRESTGHASKMSFMDESKDGTIRAPCFSEQPNNGKHVRNCLGKRRGKIKKDSFVK